MITNTIAAILAGPLGALALIVGLLFYIIRTARRLLRLEALADGWPLKRPVFIQPVRVSSIDRQLQTARLSWAEALLRSSEPLLEDGEPSWRPINEAGMRAFDAYLQEYPYGMEHTVWIDHVTIRTALQSRSWTITAGGWRQ